MIAGKITQKHFIDEELEKLWAESMKYGRGELLKYDTIEEVTGLKRDSPAWNKLKHKWRQQMLRERQIEVVAEANVGYVLLTETQQLDYAESIESRGKRNAERAATIAGVLDPNALKESDQARQKHIVGRSDRLLKLMAETKVERRALLSKWESQPRLGVG